MSAGIPQDDDGLSQRWHGRVFMNPPYSQPGKWMSKALEEVRVGNVEILVALVMARTDTRWAQQAMADAALVRLWPGRIKFERPDGTTGGLPVRQHDIGFRQPAGQAFNVTLALCYL